jgi:hypothetical protein
VGHLHSNVLLSEEPAVFFPNPVTAFAGGLDSLRSVDALGKIKKNFLKVSSKLCQTAAAISAGCPG